MQETIRINGHEYRLLFTKERQVVNGREYMATVDHDRLEICLSSTIRNAIADAVSIARVGSAAPNLPVISPSLPASDSIPVVVSGCFPMARHRWPWEK